MEIYKTSGNGWCGISGWSAYWFCPECGSNTGVILVISGGNWGTAIAKKYHCSLCESKWEFDELLKSEEEVINNKRWKILDEILNVRMM